MYEFYAEYLGSLLFYSAVAFSGNPLYVVAALAFAIAAVGKMSFAHFNPGISVWAYLAGKMSTNMFLVYLSAQILAATTVWVVGVLV
jgi:glycerol uptake facilitator-like aquaporin